MMVPAIVVSDWSRGIRPLRIWEKMGFVTEFFIKPKKAALIELPKGSFLIDRDGKLMSSTLPQSFPTPHLQAIAKHILTAFSSAQRMQMPLTELTIQYSGIKLIAREMRGGALIFLAPSGGA